MGNKETFDISITDKDYALAWFYTEFDFIDVPILRIAIRAKKIVMIIHLRFSLWIFGWK
jgi:hypothetical protein